MVYLIRNVQVIGDWARMEDASRGMVEAWKKMPQVRSVEMWSNIAGAQDEFRFVARFDSLADEEKFALALWEDKDYEKAMNDFMKVFDIGFDELVRSFD